MAKRSLLRAMILLFLVVVVTRLIIAALVPIVLDEAYYIEWSKALDWGYFDHPPLIAWVNATSWLSPSSAFMGRLGAMIAAAMAYPFMVGLFRKAGLTEPRALLAALILANLNGFVLLAGVLTTPDAVQLTTWCAALHEGAAALKGNRRRWLTAGLATGIGLLGKYTMVLIGPMFLWGIVRGDPRALRTPWPYAGVLAALLVFSPHLVWNAQNEWVSIRMQLQHGFEGGHDPGFSLSTDLPHPETPAPDGPEVRVGQYFGARLPAARVPKAPEKASVALVKRLAEYIGGVLVVWGALIGPLIHWFVLRCRRRLPCQAPLEASVKPLLVAATWVPILFFGAVSLVSKVEANWAAMYAVGAAGLLARFGGARLRHVAIHAGINVVGCLALALYAHNPGPTPGGANRVLEETAGWRELAEYVSRLDGPVLSHREQPTSMIRFYQPGLKVAQWPGLSQPSEFVRRPEWNYYDRQSLREHGSFWLVAASPLPPRLEGFEPVEMVELRHCGRQGVVVTEASAVRPYEPPCTDDTVHLWYVIRYQAADAPRGTSQ